MPTYIVTGSNRGLGLEFVHQLTSTSTPNTIIAAVRSLSGELDDLRSLAGSLSNDSQIHILACDTSSISSIHAFANELKTTLKNSAVDYLFNNAGINANPTQTALTCAPADLRTHIDINVLGPLETTKVVAPFLKRGSVIMNMTSGLGSIGNNKAKCTTYSISKAALNMYSVHAATELKERGVKVIVMDPGWVQTRMGGEEALLRPEESISGMLRVVHGLREEDSGKFFAYDGKEVQW